MATTVSRTVIVILAVLGIGLILWGFQPLSLFWSTSETYFLAQSLTRVLIGIVLIGIAKYIERTTTAV